MTIDLSLFDFVRIQKSVPLLPIQIKLYLIDDKNSIHKIIYR